MNIMCSWDLYNLPEFKALCDKIGIPHDLLTLGLTIEIGPDPDDLVKITQSYRLSDKNLNLEVNESNIIDTTTQQNKEWRTKQPCQHQN